MADYRFTEADHERARRAGRAAMGIREQKSEPETGSEAENRRAGFIFLGLLLTGFSIWLTVSGRIGFAWTYITALICFVRAFRTRPSDSAAR